MVNNLPPRTALKDIMSYDSIKEEAFRMKAIKLLCLVVSCLCSLKCCLADPASDTPITVRVASYNVVFGSMTTHHKDKYKSLLSRTPLDGTTEHEMRVNRRGFWNPASVVRATTKIEGISLAFCSLHISGSGGRKGNGHAYQLATKIVPKEMAERMIIVGDFNNNIGDEAMNIIESAGMKPTWKDLNIDLSEEFTIWHNKPEKHLGVIDHILYNTSSGAEAIEGGIIELKKPLSDHKPIWAEIIFPRKLKNVRNK